MATKEQSSGGIGFCGMLAILFIGLKLTHSIEWSWWWVLSPIWIPVAGSLAIIAVVLFIVLGAHLLVLIAATVDPKRTKVRSRATTGDAFSDLARSNRLR